MKKWFGFLLLGTAWFSLRAFGLDYSTRDLLVYSSYYAFQGAGDAVIPASEAVADYLGTLQKGGSLVARRYSCDVKAGMGVTAPNSSLIIIDLLYDVKNCVPH